MSLLSGRIFLNNYDNDKKDSIVPYEFNSLDDVNYELFQNFELLNFYIQTYYAGDKVWSFINDYIHKFGNIDNILYPFVLSIIIRK